MEEFIVDVNRSLTFQDTAQKLRYRPEDPFIRRIEIGVRLRESVGDDDFIAYIECRLWNTASQRDNAFWRYAFEYEKAQEDKPFAAVCNYLGKKMSAASLIKGRKHMTGWAVFISDFTVYEDILMQCPGMDRSRIEPKILLAIADILQYSFMIKPVYGFICESELLPETLETAEFIKLGQIGKTTVYMKNYK